MSGVANDNYSVSTVTLDVFPGAIYRTQYFPGDTPSVGFGFLVMPEDITGGIKTTVTPRIRISVKDRIGWHLTSDWDSNLERYVTLDGNLPTVTVTDPGGAVSAVDTISGMAYDDVKLLKARLGIRENSTNRYWTGNAFGPAAQDYMPIEISAGVAGSTQAVWNYTGLDDEKLVHLTSYTVIAQAEDSVGNLSEAAYSTFTFDLCSSEPPFLPSEKTTLSGYVRPGPLYPADARAQCEVVVCDKRAAVNIETGYYKLSGITPPELRSGARTHCIDEERRCPDPEPHRRQCKCGGSQQWRDCGNFEDDTCRDSIHQGLDLPFTEDPEETPSFVDKYVFSGIDGEVVLVGEMKVGDIAAGKSWGYTILVRAKRKVEGKYAYVLYGHLENGSSRVSPGDAIVSGHLIGDGGKTGNAWKARHKHTHVEVRLMDELIPPQPNGDGMPLKIYGRFLKAKPYNPDVLFECNLFRSKSP